MSTTENMTLTKALSELKLITKKIEQKISDSSFIDVKVGTSSQKTLSGRVITEFKEKAKSDYDSVNAMLVRRAAIKRALVVANAQTKLKVAGKEMTIAEAIEYKTSVVLERALLAQMEIQIASATRHFVNADNKFKAEVTKAENYNVSNEISDSARNSMREAMRDTAAETHSPDYVDPLALREVVDKLKDKIDNFEAEVDVALSVVNATTGITVEY